MSKRKRDYALFFEDIIEAIGFRNVLIHDYFGVDIEAVWDTIKKNIPEFKNHIQFAYNSESKK